MQTTTVVAMPECGPHRVTVRICLPSDLKRRLEKLREELGVSISYMIEATLKRYLDKTIAEMVEESKGAP